ncbi:preprotein translocase subunit YajC [Pelagibius litoralis]|uniref:Sec translocon accessory complex subunit YajC n=1 Tax=Pelagibius litoralis TaxID=374515 RepID=A0A967EX39_9PROT|nr:preprotein translocase subunit YajC [Pelagibius litoralis]NIA67550.1 preprotein translocase subunit YajC [Pelagibius litoralis]
MLISPAYAQASGGGADLFTSFLPIILIFVVFYFLLIRPQQKKVKMHRDMVQSLRRGDKVVTGGGLIGTVTKVLSDTEVQLELAEGVRVRAMRSTIQDVMSRTEAAPGKGSAPAPANDGGGGPKGLGGLLGGLLGGSRKPNDKS